VGSSTLNTAAGSSVTWAGPVTGADLNKMGAGTLILGGNNTYGATTVSAGTLQIGNGGSAGTLGSGAVVNNTALVFSRSNDVTVSNAISGLGMFSKLGSNTLTLTGAQTYTGATNIAAGGLVFQNDAAPATPSFTGAGRVVIEPSGSSFSAAVSNLYSFATTLSEVRVGKTSNTANLLIGSSINVAGPISLYGGHIFVNGGLLSSASGAITLKASSSATVLGSISTAGQFTATAGSSDQFVLGLDFTTGAGSTLVANGGVSVTAGTSYVAGNVTTQNNPISFTGALEVANYDSAPNTNALVLNANGGNISVTGNLSA
jgi:autotransporter-associated beta strand protein